MIKKRILITVLSGLFILLSASAVIIIAKGYQFNLTQKTIKKTGMFIASSTPSKASIYIDGHLSGVTPSSIGNLLPKIYGIKLVKEGHSPWEREIEIKEELVTEIEATLFRTTPELKPITLNGCLNPLFSPDSLKVTFQVRQGEKQGIWILDMTNRPLGLNQELRLIAENSDRLKFSKAALSWSPDSKTILATLQENQNPDKEFTRNFLLETDRLNHSFDDISLTLDTLFENWEKENEQKNKERLGRLEETIQKQITENKNVLWSPNSLMIYFEESGERKIYNLKLKKLTTLNLEDLSELNQISWYSDSEHLIITEKTSPEENKGSINIIEADGKNKSSIYKGPLYSTEVYPSPGGEKLFILTTFNEEKALPNLYSINLL